MKADTSPDFFESVYKMVRRIPYGKVTTYGHIARTLGSIRSARMVGWALSHCPDDVPAHRVVNAIGLLTGKYHFPGENLMRELLENEGITVKNDKVINFQEHLWIPEINR